MTAYRGLSHHPDDHLGWFQLGDTIFALRQRNPFKETFDTTKLKKGSGFEEMAEQWGMILATEHVRADMNTGTTFCKSILDLVKGNRKDFRKLVREVAVGYAAQVERDYEAFMDVLAPDDCEDVG